MINRPARVALLCALPGCALAQPPADRPFYLGVDLGPARLEREYPEFGASPGSERDAPGWKLSFGYRFSPYLALEVAHTSFGSYRGSTPLAFPVDGSGGGAAVDAAHTTSAKGIDLSLEGTWPLGETFYLNASAGLVRREFKTLLHAAFLGANSFRARDGDIGTQLGFGFGFHVNDALDIGARWVTTRNLQGDMEYPENAADPEMAAVGVRLRF